LSVKNKLTNAWTHERSLMFDWYVNDEHGLDFVLHYCHHEKTDAISIFELLIMSHYQTVFAIAAKFQ